ncbi:hypothetical protein Y032_0016g2963 [Ancylostoma ceylanicum]|uniref:Integrase catalytic domain-containing protein n=1 Tax=Ancylostoma ceylanicum TaxID=53326 RepID=A0A016V546_9BILA|nr:hypothetical protein Y032_0016g2963 [Ancylostoma ceylanicum]
MVCLYVYTCMLQRNQLVYGSLINSLTGRVGNPPDQMKKMVRIISDSLSKCCSEAKDLWSDLLQPIVFAHNSSINDSTGYSPFFVIHGRNPITWTDILHKLPTSLTFATDSFAGQFAAALRTTIVEVATNITTKTAL